MELLLDLKENFNYCVYKHTFPNGKVYIGITGLEPERRWRNGEGYKSQVVYQAIKEYGWENIVHEIITEGLTEQEALLREEEEIAKHNATHPDYGYNQWNISYERKKHLDISEALRLWEQGLNCTKIGERLGYNRTTVSKYLKAQGITDEEILSRKGRKKGTEFDYDAIAKDLESGLTRQQVADKHGCGLTTIGNVISQKSLNVECARPSQEVYQYLENGELVTSYPSINSAMKKTGYATIPDALKNEHGWSHGYIWSKKELTKEEVIQKAKTSSTKGHKRGVVQYDLQGNELAFFTSMKEASRTTNVSYLGIMNCLNGKQGTAGGFKWKQQN